MKQLDVVVDHLRAIVSEVEERIQLYSPDRFAPDMVDANLALLPKSSPRSPTPEDGQDAGTPSEAAEPTVDELSASLGSLLHRAAVAQLAMSLKLRAARARQVLISKHKASVPEERVITPGSSVALERRMTVFRDAVIATVRRAVEPNGIVSRPAETLISSLVSLVPGLEGRRPAYEKSLVPDAFVDELSVALEVAAQDFALTVGDHFEVLWRSQILPMLDADIRSAGLKLHDFAPATIRELLGARRVREAIHKVCEDFAMRMRSGGVSALSINMPPPIKGGDVLKGAVRYPMQFVAIGTYLFLPAAAILGIAVGGSVPSLLKTLIPFFLPFLVIYAIVQARALRRTAVELGLRLARQSLRTEIANSAREIGDIISASFREFLNEVLAKLDREVVAAAASARRGTEREGERLLQLERTVLDSRIKALSGLGDELDKSLAELHQLLAKMSADKTRETKRTKVLASAAPVAGVSKP